MFLLQEAAFLLTSILYVNGMLYMLTWHTRVFKLRQLIAECIALCCYKSYLGMKISLAF